MANALTYNQIIDVLKDIATRHYQINTFVLGRNWDLDNQIQDNIYPVLQVYVENASFPQTSNAQYQTVEVSLNLKIIDLETNDQFNEQYVHSDTLQIAQDVINEINQHPYFMDANLSIVGDINLSALNEYEDDITAGWEFVLTLQLINNNSFCGLPMTPITSNEFFGPVSTGYSQSVSYLTCGTLTGCTSFISYVSDAIAPAFSGATFSAGTITFTTIGGTEVILTGISSTNTYVTGGTYNNGTTTLIRNDGGIVTINGYYTGTTQSEYWTSGSTGYQSIKANNDSSLDATGDYSVAEGSQTLASGNFGSHAEGANTTASGISSHSEGSDTIASGDYSHSEGILTTASGYAAHAEGESTTASGNNSHAEGWLTVATGSNGAHAEGQETTAAAPYTHAEGYLTTASNTAAHAEGYGTIASGTYSHSEGYQTIASGYNSHAGGYDSIASGTTSFVHGSGSTAGGAGTIVLGDGITGLTDNTTYVNKLNIKSVQSGTLINNIGIDSSGNVIIGSTAATSTDTYTTGFTYSNNLFTIRNSTGGTLTASINTMTGLTVNGILSATTISASSISATTYYNIPFIFGSGSDNNGGTVSSGVTGYMVMGYSGRIEAWDLIGATSGSVIMDIWKSTGSTLPTVSNSITAGNYPQISTGVYSGSSTLTGWGTTFNAGDKFGFNVISISGFTNISLSLRGKRA